MDLSRFKAQPSVITQWVQDTFDAGDLLASVNHGIVARNRGDMEAAETLFKMIIEHDALNPFAHYELAFLYSTTDRHFDALRQFELLLQSHPQDERAMKGLAKSAAYLGGRGKIRNALARLPLTDSTVELTSLLIQFSDFVDNFPHDDVKAQLAQLESRNTYLHCSALCDEIITAIRRSQPFSLIRLGDGEGTRVKIGLQDEVQYNDLYKYCRRVLTDIWFTPAFVDQNSQFDMLSLELPCVLRNASVLGIPYQSWLDHEHRIASITGVTSLTNLIRLLCSFPQKDTPSLCVQNIHFALARSDLFDRLFREERKFGIITCHSALGPAIERKFGVKDVTVYKIPGEGAYKEVLNDQADTRFHFPSVFNEMRVMLKAQKLTDHVILVAAGYLGKFYCDDIKQSGGVAIDIGSIADGWMGKNTRPGMSSVIGL